MDCLPFRWGQCGNITCGTVFVNLTSSQPAIGDRATTPPSPTQRQSLMEDAAVPTIRSLPPAPGLTLRMGTRGGEP